MASTARGTSSAAQTYFLHNVDDYLREIAKSQETQKWIHHRLDNSEDVYIITACHTLKDVQVFDVTKHVLSAESGLKASIPTIFAYSKGSFYLMPDGLQFKGSMKNAGSVKLSFKADGEQIAAVQYQKMKFSWFKSKDLTKMGLESKAYWFVPDEHRGNDDEEDDEDAVEMELEGMIVDDDFDEMATSLQIPLSAGGDLGRLDLAGRLQETQT